MAKKETKKTTLGQGLIKALEETVVAEQTNVEPTYDQTAVDCIREGKEFFRIELAYNSQSGESKVLTKTRIADSIDVAVFRMNEYFAYKLSGVKK